MTALSLLLALGLLGGCAGGDRAAVIDRAETSVNEVKTDPAVQDHASVDLSRTEEELQRLHAADDDGADFAEIEHIGYLVEQRAAITGKRAEERSAWATIEELGDQREEILLDVQRQATERAERRANAAEIEAEAAVRQAEAERDRTARIQGELQDLKAERTARGLVVTLDDVLFEVDEATLKPGGITQLERLAGLLQEAGAESVLVEGHTDSQGSESYNSRLSQERAAAVRDALITGGVPAEMIRARGLGESYPVATNTTEAGRQQNRRVEIVVQEG
jgi:outer membrane protein OmpA-like peptidoglycan-associated protein